MGSFFAKDGAGRTIGTGAVCCIYGGGGQLDASFFALIVGWTLLASWV
jgi:hypothetical protein